MTKFNRYCTGILIGMIGEYMYRVNCTWIQIMIFACMVLLMAIDFMFPGLGKIKPIADTKKENVKEQPRECDHKHRQQAGFSFHNIEECCDCGEIFYK